MLTPKQLLRNDIVHTFRNVPGIAGPMVGTSLQTLGNFLHIVSSETELIVIARFTTYEPEADLYWLLEPTLAVGDISRERRLNKSAKQVTITIGYMNNELPDIELLLAMADKLDLPADGSWAYVHYTVD